MGSELLGDFFVHVFAMRFCSLFGKSKKFFEAFGFHTTFHEAMN